MDPWKKKLKLWKLYFLRLTPYSVLAFLLFCAVFSIINSYVLPSSKSKSSSSQCAYSNLAPGELIVNPCDINDDMIMVTKPLVLPSSSSSRDHDLYYATVFKRLLVAGFVSVHSKSLTLDSTNGEDIVALKKLGVTDVTGITHMPSELFIVSGQKGIRHPFKNNTFDFEFFGYNTRFKYWTSYPAYSASEIGRTLKVGGYVVIHVVINDQYSFNSFVNLFKWCCTLVSSNQLFMSGPNLLLEEGQYFSTTMHELIFKKEIIMSSSSKKLSLSLSRPPPSCDSSVRRKMVEELEPLADFEAPYSWEGTFGNDKATLKYVSAMVDLSFKERYIYIDVGANSYNTSIGTWFENEYPKQNKPFEIYAIEADKGFQEEYYTGNNKMINFLPYAAWVRNETLSFQVYKVTPNEGETFNYMGYIPEKKKKEKEELATMRESFTVEGFDFVEWLQQSLRLTERDYVVMKMDVEGSEIHLLKKMKESGTLCLIDELFLECHYDRWLKCCSGPKSNKYKYTFRQCYNTFKELREQHGCIAHQWW